MLPSVHANASSVVRTTHGLRAQTRMVQRLHSWPCLLDGHAHAAAQRRLHTDPLGDLFHQSMTERMVLECSEKDSPRSDSEFLCSTSVKQVDPCTVENTNACSSGGPSHAKIMPESNFCESIHPCPASLRP